MDFRIEKTYKLLIDGFTQLMHDKKYDEITVQELCDKSMVRRPTFYRHFADKSEFFTFYVKSLRDEFAKSTRRDEIYTPSEWGVYMLKQMLKFLSKNKKLVENIITSSNSSILIDSLGEVVKNDLMVVFKNNTSNDPKQKNLGGYYYTASFLSGGIVSMARDWITQGQKEQDIEVMVETYKQFYNAI